MASLHPNVHHNERIIHLGPLKRGQHRHRYDRWGYKHSHKKPVFAAHKPAAMLKHKKSLQRNRRAAQAEDKLRSRVRDKSLPHAHRRRKQEELASEAVLRGRHGRSQIVPSLPLTRLNALKRAVDGTRPTRFDTEAWLRWRHKNIAKLQPYYPKTPLTDLCVTIGQNSLRNDQFNNKNLSVAELLCFIRHTKKLSRTENRVRQGAAAASARTWFPLEQPSP